MTSPCFITTMGTAELDVLKPWERPFKRTALHMDDSKAWNARV